MEKTIKTAISVNIPLELAESIRDIAYWNPEHTVTSLVTEALYEKVNQFKDIAARPNSKLRPGKKIS